MQCIHIQSLSIVSLSLCQDPFFYSEHDRYTNVNTEFNQFNQKSITDYRYDPWVNSKSGIRWILDYGNSERCKFSFCIKQLNSCCIQCDMHMHTSQCWCWNNISSSPILQWGRMFTANPLTTGHINGSAPRFKSLDWSQTNHQLKHTFKWEILCGWRCKSLTHWVKPYLHSTDTRQNYRTTNWRGENASLPGCCATILSDVSHFIPLQPLNEAANIDTRFDRRGRQCPLVRETIQLPG